MSYIKIKNERLNKDVWINTKHIVMIERTENGKANRILLSSGSDTQIITSLTVENIFHLIKKSI